MSENHIRYTSRTYESILRDMQAAIPTLAPNWTNHGKDEVGMALLALMAGASDGLHYMLDRLVFENYPSTAKLRRSLVRLSHLLGTRPRRWSSAVGDVIFSTDTPLPQSVNIPPLTHGQSDQGFSLVLAEGLSLPAGWTGSRKVKAYEGSLQSFSVLSTGDNLQEILLPQENVAEQFFSVEVDNIPWFEIGTQPIDENFREIYYLGEDADGRSLLRFKSGLASVPQADQTITVKYLRTSGRDFPAGSVSFSSSVTGANYFNKTHGRFVGSQAPDDLERLRDRATFRVWTRDKAVTIEDYTILAKSFPGVHDAVAQALGVAFLRVVDVWVAFKDPNNPGNNALLAEIQNFLKARSDINKTVVVRPAVFRNFVLELSIRPKPGYALANLITTVYNDLQDMLSYDNLSFGQRISLGAVYNKIYDIPGIAGAEVVAFHWEDEPVQVRQVLGPKPVEYPVLSQLRVF